MFPDLRPCLALVIACAVAAIPVYAADEQRIVRDAVAVAKQLRNSDDIYDQFTGAGTLVELGDKDSLQFIADKLEHPDWVIMRSAIDTLLTVQHPDGLNLIYSYAAVAEDSMFMKFLSESLASRPREDMAEFLMGSLDIDDLWVRKHALQALAVVAMDDKEARMRAVAEDTEMDATTRAYAYYALMDTDARLESMKKLIEISSHWGAESQEAAAVALGLIDNEETKAALKQLRKAKTYKVQIAALASEAGFGNQESIDTLVQIIAHGKGLDPSVAAASVRRMPAAIAAEITETLMACCKLNSDVATRLLESWAAVKSDPSKVYEWGLENMNPDIRMQAVWLVGQRGDRAYIERIAPLLNDADSGIRGMTAWAIVRMLGDSYEPGVEI